MLGTSIAYFLSAHAKDPGSVALIEQESNIARHTSGRNTGKVHAPFLYDPAKKKTFAKAASLGYEMWQKYSDHKGLPFKRDGVLEVAQDDKGIGRLNVLDLQVQIRRTPKPVISRRSKMLWWIE